MELDGIDVFVRVVEAGSFSEAARRLEMPKSTVSLRIARLEKRLGVVLLKRTTRSVRPTEAGFAYFNTATRVLSELRAVEEDVKREQGEPRGTLRISTTGTGAGPIGDLVTKFLSKYPEIGVDLHLSEHQVDLVAENIDVAIRFGKIDDDRLVARRIGTALRKMFASPSYLARRPAPHHPRELHEHEILRTAKMREVSLVNERGTRFRATLSARFTSNRISAVRHQAIGGLGITFLPMALAAVDVRRGLLVPVLPEWSFDPDPIHIVYAKQRFVPQKVRAFVEFAVRSMPIEAFGERRSEPQ
ncbi:Transcriptional regulator, LysR family protein [Minicystis rosea]|nr:Transcriptional regulator, LysR family protein [Minicystis rosea]